MKGVSSSLAATDKALKSTGSELSKINKQLKFDPTNTELLAQKHDILSKHLQTSRERVDQLSQMLRLVGTLNYGMTRQALRFGVSAPVQMVLHAHLPSLLSRQPSTKPTRTQQPCKSAFPAIPTFALHSV